MAILYRSMRKENGAPQACTTGGFCLGVRVCSDEHCDVDVAEDGLIHPGTGGMSVAPDDPLYLPAHRKPKAFGGSSPHPLWMTLSGALPDELCYQPDEPKSEGPYEGSVIHGTIQPVNAVLPDQLQDCLRGTQDVWEEVELP